MATRIPVLIMGAAGRDFHNFNTKFRNDPTRNVVAFTATQIPGIADRKYPKELAGALYPEGIPIHDEADLAALIDQFKVKEVYFSYSDVPYRYVMNRASICQAHGATFCLINVPDTQLVSKKPVISVTAVRTGSGKSQTTRYIGELLLKAGLKVAAIRHPMPYGDLNRMRCQRFATREDLEVQQCTIEEREEYEPHLASGIIVYAGVDYQDILEAAEKEVDVILWDGGNNDWPFYRPDLNVVVADPHRVGHESGYFPGEVNVRLADVIVINKEDSAKPENIAQLVENLKALNSRAQIVHADSILLLSHPESLHGKKVLAVEDGPTLTHGEMKYGAAVVAAQRNGGVLVDPRPWAVGTITDTFKKYRDIGTLLPAMGYSEQQVHDLGVTMERTECDIVLIGTPIDLVKLLEEHKTPLNKPSVRIGYNLLEKNGTPLKDRVAAFIKERFGKDI